MHHHPFHVGLAPVHVPAMAGSGKTPFLLQLGSCVSAQRRFLGHVTHRCRVGYIDLESSPGQLRRQIPRQWRALHIEPSAVGDAFELLGRGNKRDPNCRELERICRSALSNAERCAWLGTLVRQQQYGIVIVDTALALWPIAAKDDLGVRELFAELSKIAKDPPYPAILLSVHLRKRLRQAPPPPLADDPRGWCDEILGSVVWAASSDVRLGLEDAPASEHVVCAGYRRGEGLLHPLVIKSAVETIDGQSEWTHWRRCRGTEVAAAVLTPKQQEIFAELPEGKWMTLAAIQELTGKARVTVWRFVKAAPVTGLFEVHRGNPTMYRRTPSDTEADQRITY